MAKNTREKIAKRRERSRKRRLKLSVKIFIVFFCIFLAGGGYVGYKYYQYKHSPNPFGEMDDIYTSQQNTYDITDDAMAEAKYWVLNVGSGEAIYVKSGSTDILIDTGSDEKAEAVIKEIEKEIGDDLDYLIITSPSERRIGGVGAIYDRFKPEKIIACDLGDKEQMIKDAVHGAEIELGESKTIKLSENSSFTVFKPEVSSKDPYDHSLMTFFKYGDTAFFAESDAGEEEESRILGRVDKCDVFVLARGGSDEVNQHAKDIGAGTYVISAAKSEGVPSEKLALALRGGICATFKNGTIKFSSNGKQVQSNVDRGDYVGTPAEEAKKEAEEKERAEREAARQQPTETQEDETTEEDSGDEEL